MDDFTGKIVVYSGYPREGAAGKHAEVIDLLNHDANCEDFGLLEIGVSRAFGGHIGKYFVVCGGKDENHDIRKECYKVGETTPFLQLLQPRYEGASIVLHS